VADAVVLIGFRNAGVAGLDCGACGYKECDQMLEAQKVKKDFKGHNAVLNIWTWE
jgi:uncharacterized ferredoxin-like protein